MRVCFQGFVLDTAMRQLFRGETRVHLEPKALELLELLVARRPEAVAKTEIQRRLWPDTFVSESSLTGLVAQVRKALGDDRRQERFLRTVHGFGYAFNGEIVTTAGTAHLGRLGLPASAGRERGGPVRGGDGPHRCAGSVTPSRPHRRDGGPGDDRGPRQQERDSRQ
jgi:DNA-binding winged helix-turn-helix (wHTH) protein